MGDLSSRKMNKFEIMNSPEIGRYAIAPRNYESGELIEEETVFIYGPKQMSTVVCLGCYRPLISDSTKSSRCPKCKWPLCLRCTNASEHFGECSIFVNAKAKFQDGINLESPCPQLDCITPLRLLLKKEIDPERWDREIEPMEYHNSKRQESQDTWNADLINIAKYLRGPCKLSRFSEELIMRAIGILQVNAFEAKTPHGYPIRCLFPQTGILAHNCVPNIMRTIYPTEGYRIRLRALVDIKEEEQLVVSYTYTLTGTAERQAHLKTGKYFTCNCDRCSDPTELGTYFSSLKCKICNTGFVTITNPFDDTSIWKCSKCDCTVPSSSIGEILAPILSEVNAVEAMEFNQARLEHSERLYRKYSTSLHPLHYIQTNLRQNMIEMYGRVSGYELANLPISLLQYKAELCRIVLKVLDIFEPGLSRSRAITLYELHAPLVLIARKLYSSGTLYKEEYWDKLDEAIAMLEESVQILGNEDSTSQEGLLAAIGRKGLEQLQQSMEESE